MKNDNKVYIPDGLSDFIRDSFSIDYILAKDSLDAAEKLAYYQAIKDVINFLDFNSET